MHMDSPSLSMMLTEALPRLITTPVSPGAVERIQLKVSTFSSRPSCKTLTGTRSTVSLGPKVKSCSVMDTKSSASIYQRK